MEKVSKDVLDNCVLTALELSDMAQMGRVSKQFQDSLKAIRALTFTSQNKACIMDYKKEFEKVWPLLQYLSIHEQDFFQLEDVELKSLLALKDYRSRMDTDEWTSLDTLVGSIPHLQCLTVKYESVPAIFLQKYRDDLLFLRSNSGYEMKDLNDCSRIQFLWGRFSLADVDKLSEALFVPKLVGMGGTFSKKGDIRDPYPIWKNLFHRMESVRYLYLASNLDQMGVILNLLLEDTLPNLEALHLWARNSPEFGDPLFPIKKNYFKELLNAKKKLRCLIFEEVQIDESDRKLLDDSKDDFYVDISVYRAGYPESKSELDFDFIYVGGGTTIRPLITVKKWLENEVILEL